MKTAEDYFSERNGGKEPSGDLITETWAVEIARGYAAELAKEIEALRKELTIRRMLTKSRGLEPSGFCSGHQNAETCSVCYPDLQALILEHCKVSESLRKENEELRKYVPNSIPQWIIEYDRAGYQSSAGKAIRELLERVRNSDLLLNDVISRSVKKDEQLTRLRSLLERCKEYILFNSNKAPFLAMVEKEELLSDIKRNQTVIWKHHEETD